MQGVLLNDMVKEKKRFQCVKIAFGMTQLILVL